MTKTVVSEGKAKRAGDGENRCEYGGEEDHFRVADRNRKRVGTDVFPTLQATGMQENSLKYIVIRWYRRYARVPNYRDARFSYQGNYSSP